jgi:nucleotide-binding universal stress UspA family protein
MPSTIVCGVDTSDAANAIADTAGRLARGLGARLILLNVAPETDPDGIVLLDSLSARLGLGEGDARQVEGSPAERLLEAVDQEGAELLVVGSRGRGAIRSAVFGSVSRKLATDATCPVVVVPPDVSAPDGDEASIVCGVDGSDHSLAAVRLAADLAKRLGLRLIVVHAVADFSSYVSYPGGRGGTSPSTQPDTARKAAQEVVDAAVAAAGGDATGVVESGLPWDALDDVADRENGQLVVVAARGQSAARAAVLGSAAAKLATDGRHPLVVLPEAAEH